MAHQTKELLTDIIIMADMWILDDQDQDRSWSTEHSTKGMFIVVTNAQSQCSSSRGCPKTFFYIGL